MNDLKLCTYLGEHHFTDDTNLLYFDESAIDINKNVNYEIKTHWIFAGQTFEQLLVKYPSVLVKLNWYYFHQ